MKRRIAILLLLGPLLLAAEAWAVRTPMAKNAGAATNSAAGGEKPAPVWRRTIKEAMTVAGMEYRPVFVLFTSPTCGWCVRLKTAVLSDPEVLDLLREYSMVEVDVSREPDTAERYQVRGVPAIAVLSSDGEVRMGVTGYISAPEMKKILKQGLNPEFLKAKSSSHLEILAMLNENRVASNQWATIMMELGSAEKRKDIQSRILKLSPFPRRELVDLLADAKLSVRLGALEMIEEITGKEWGFDPWLDAGPAGTNAAAIARLQAWANESPDEMEGQRTIYSSLTQEQILSLIQDLISEDTDRSVRAMRMLEQGGAKVTEALAGFLAEHKDLPAGAKNRLREVRYVLVLKNCGGVDASSTARKLLYGNPDIRMKALGELQRGGLWILPLLCEFLEDPDPIVREAAVESMLGAGGWRAVPFLKEHLIREKDRDVIYSILKNLGRTRSSAGVAVLTSYLTNANEDLVVAALNSLAKLKTAKAQSEILKCLSDSRWRVRVAALETAGELKLRNLSDKVAGMLKDEDSFVRYAAVKALTAIEAKSAAAKLEEAFVAEDALKAPVMAAYCSMETSIPKRFHDALKSKSPDLILGVLEAMGDCHEKDLWIPEKFLEDENLDIACAATRLIAHQGMGLSTYRGRIVSILRKGRREQVLAALESVRLGSELLATIVFPAEPSGGGGGTPAAGTNQAPGAADKTLDNLMDAFTTGPAAVPAVVPAAATSTAVTSEAATSAAARAAGPAGGTDGDVFAAFLGAETPAAGTGGVSAATAESGVSLSELAREVEKCMEKGDDKDIRFRAARLSAQFGNPKALPALAEGLALRPADERVSVIQVLNRLAGKDVLPLVKNLLGDTSEEVRTEAAEYCVRNAKQAGLLEAMFAELGKPDRALKATDIPVGELEPISESAVARRVAGQWARSALKERAGGMLQNLALIVLEYCWSDGDVAVVRELAKSEDPWRRRAALHALGRRDMSAFTNEVARIVADPSEHVRAVLPAIFSRESTRWVDYLDRDHFKGSRYYYSYHESQNLPRKMAPQVRTALLRLATDDSPYVRVETLFCLLSNREPIDLFEFIKTVESFPDQSVIVERVADFLSSNFETLGPGFVVLVPYVERSRHGSYALDRIRRHFKTDPEKGQDDALSVILRKEQGATLAATYMEKPVETGKRAPQKPKLIYFTTPGCQGCEKVESYLERLKERISALEVETYNIRQTRAIQLNEALSERLGVPEGLRLIAPAVFGGAGFLVKTDITEPALRDLVERSEGVPEEEWLKISPESLAKADQALSKRSAMGFGFVALGGLVDGLNPCAFATIIFMLSYLQITRRNPREILWVGISFIVAVFLAYFAMGLGLLEVVAKAQKVLRWFRQVLNWGLAGFSLVIMALSVWDGVRCLRGRLEDITLQLPGVLKAGIHGAIRRGSRQAHFVIAAFVVGLAISVLELACTGQMYLPMIGYMIGKGDNMRLALEYLVAYNLMFVAPLVLIFIVAGFGMTSEALIRVLRKRAALVKFSTAGLFLLLFLFFMFGDRIQFLVEK